ncbi:hypothetical protein [Sorangium sp. So ce145]|uniref:hypothetical protein n=1 Tax=Sorangium sp. So ce145 TaxID=3133285 RepID=UPI003F5DBFF9
MNLRSLAPREKADFTERFVDVLGIGVQVRRAPRTAGPAADGGVEHARVPDRVGRVAQVERAAPQVGRPRGSEAEREEAPRLGEREPIELPGGTVPRGRTVAIRRFPGDSGRA